MCIPCRHSCVVRLLVAYVYCALCSRPSTSWQSRAILKRESNLFSGRDGKREMVSEMVNYWFLSSLVGQQLTIFLSRFPNCLLGSKFNTLRLLSLSLSVQRSLGVSPFHCLNLRRSRRTSRGNSARLTSDSQATYELAFIFRGCSFRANSWTSNLCFKIFLLQNMIQSLVQNALFWKYDSWKAILFQTIKFITQMGWSQSHF